MIASCLQFILIISLGVVSPAFGLNRFCRSINRMDCSKGFVPNVICADDGVSYPNDCAFSKALCKNPGLKEKYKGECIMSTEPLPTTTMVTTEQPTTTELYTTQVATEPTTLERLTTEELVTQPPATESTPVVDTIEPTTEDVTQALTPQNPVTDDQNWMQTTQEPITEEKISEAPSTETPLIDELRNLRIKAEINFTAVISVEDDPEPNTTTTPEGLSTSEGPYTSDEPSTIEEPNTPTGEIVSTEDPSQASTLAEESSTTAPESVTSGIMSAITTRALKISTMPFNPIVESFLCTWVEEKEVYCDPSHKDYACASDHKTYRTRCDLVKARCDYPGIYMVQEGICPGHKLLIEYTHHQFLLHIIE